MRSRSPPSSNGMSEGKHPIRFMLVDFRCMMILYFLHLFNPMIRILNVTPAKEAGITAGVPNYFENSCSEIKYKRIPVYDSSSSNLLSYSDEIVEFISSGLHHGGVLVHCQKGVSRSATAVAMFLMR